MLTLAALGLALVAGAALVAFGQAAPAAILPSAKPQRIFSANLCTDLLLMMLVPKERIASVSHLAHDAAEVIMPGADEGIAVNQGTAEEVVRQQPDLILAGLYTTPVMRRIAAEAGIPMVEVDVANNFGAIRRITRQVGRAVGEAHRAEALIARMDRTLSELAATQPEHPIKVIAWSGGSSVPGKGTLHNAIIEAAGAINLAAEMPDASFSSFGIEELLAARPQALMRGSGRYDEPSLRESASEHPVVASAFRGRRITYSEPLSSCGLPLSAEAARNLRATLAALPPGEVDW